MNSYLDVAIEAAREAGSILLAEFSRPQSISYKGDADLVTEGDRQSEAAIVARIRNYFPRHTIVAEEGTGHDAAGGGAPAAFRWYVDPLDGTTNFAHGYPCFAVSIALAEIAAPDAPEELLAGVVFNPVSGEMFTAARGEGAYLNRKRIRVSDVARLAAGLLATGFPAHKRTQSPNIQYYWDFTLASHGVRRDGSAALDLAAVACGRFDGFWEFGLHPWDTGAGTLLVREAGGQVTDFAGRPYRLGAREILASNGKIHAEMQQVAADIAARSPSPR